MLSTSCATTCAIRLWGDKSPHRELPLGSCRPFFFFSLPRRFQNRYRAPTTTTNLQRRSRPLLRPISFPPPAHSAQEQQQQPAERLLRWNLLKTSDDVVCCCQLLLGSLSLSPKSIAPRFLEISALAQPVIRAELTPTGESILEKKKRRESSAMCCTGRLPYVLLKVMTYSKGGKKRVERRKSVHFLFTHPRASALIPLPFWAGPTAVPFSTFAYYHIECGWLADSAFIFRPWKAKRCVSLLFRVTGSSSTTSLVQ